MKTRVITVFPPYRNSSSNLKKERTTIIIEGKDRDTLRASLLLFPTYAPQHYCSSTTPWPLERLSISADEFDNPQSQLALLRTSGPPLLPHSEAVTHVKDLKYTFSASRHGTLDVLIIYPEAKPTDMQPCQFSQVFQKVQCISVLTLL